ncbi:MAG: SURF1 family protein [Sulfitobacter sp.]
MRRLLFLVIVALGGAGVLLSLGAWQVQRLAWKQEVLAQLEAKIAADPVPLPMMPSEEADNLRPVTAIGQLGPDFIQVLVSQKQIGAGYRVISPMQIDRGDATIDVLLDRGFVPVDQAGAITAPQGEIAVIGNLHWPVEVDGYTPDPDLNKNIWFARDVAAMAAHLGTQPVLIVARSLSPADPAVTPLPVDKARIPNDHLQYAITWFSLAAIWLAMSIYFLRRRARITES